MITSVGTIVSFSQPSAQIPSMKPNRLNEIDVSTRNSTMMTG